MRVMTSASIQRKPRCCRPSTISTSKAVTITPTISGTWKSRFKAIAAPITSATSHATMAISAEIQSKIDVGFEVGGSACLRQIAPGDETQLRAQRLKEHRHKARDHDHA